MTKGVSLATLAVIIHSAFLFPPFAVTQKSTQDLMEMLLHQESQSSLRWGATMLNWPGHCPRPSSEEHNQRQRADD